MAQLALADLNYRNLLGGGDTLIDEAGAGITYVCESLNPGDATNSPTWRVQRVNESANPTQIKWANGSSKFEHTYDDRASYSY